MKCPKCGYPRLRYKESRKALWKGKEPQRREQVKESRKNFQVECPKCSFKGEYKTFLDEVEG